MTHTPRLTALFVVAILLLPLSASAGVAVPKAQNGVPRAMDGSKLAPAEAQAASGQKIFRGAVGDYPARMTLRRSPGGGGGGAAQSFYFVEQPAPPPTTAAVNIRRAFAA